MNDEKKRHYMPDSLIDATRAGAQTIVVRQVLGEKEKQKAMDIRIWLPEGKPAVEQIVDVFVKNVEVNAVDVITNKVIVRGEYEVKAIYVANLPDKPVHAVELKHCKWTVDLDIPGARKGMDADANVVVEFVDYDVPMMTRAYKYKYHGCDDSCADSCCKDSCDSLCMPLKPPHKPKPPCDHMCKPPKPPMNPCPSMNPCPPMNPCQPPKPPCVDPCQVKVPFPGPSTEMSCREFDVSVVLKVVAKVIVDREVQINAGTVPQPELPNKPKG